MEKTSDIKGFYKLTIEERLKIVQDFAGLSDDEVNLLSDFGCVDQALINRMVENVIGVMPVPLGIATNFLINNKDYLVPMAIEEPSVIAAASNAARIARVRGGFIASTTEPLMIGQIQLTDIHDPYGAKMKILSNKDKIIALANEQDPLLVRVGGGAKDIETKVLDTFTGKIVVVHLLVDCRDAMGPNAVNTMAEAVAPLLETISGGKSCLRIVSNLAIYRLARATAIFDANTIGDDDAVDRIIKAYAFAVADPFRCATHNKGIMNGISAVAIATSNDFRALEAGAHSYAVFKDGHRYKPLTTWEKNKDGDLVGTIELPMAVGIIGGATAVHPIAKINRKILGVQSAKELAEVMASVGLAQNFAALRALATEGIQRGHMKLHARNIAIMAGASIEEVDEIVKILVEDKKVRIDRAKEILNELRARKGKS